MGGACVHIKAIGSTPIPHQRYTFHYVYLLWVQCTHAEWTEQQFLHFTEGIPGILWREEVWRDNHGDGEIRAELVVRIALSGSKAVLVDARAMNVARFLSLSLIGLLAIARDPEIGFKTVSENLAPVRESDVLRKT